ncbi:targeting protein for Xklp2 homolog [Ornithodoros turicata]|uniref:targeting protein for Xklp2 homolog n=1 Tax=Ornithodoros turicata TaxID=34597 RepID=UPI003139448C
MAQHLLFYVITCLLRDWSLVSSRTARQLPPVTAISNSNLPEPAMSECKSNRRSDKKQACGMWEFDCPKFRDFSQPHSLEDSTRISEKYFDFCHDISYIDTSGMSETQERQALSMVESSKENAPRLIKVPKYKKKNNKAPSKSSCNKKRVPGNVQPGNRSPFKAMAQVIHEFHVKTPSRFHTRSSRTDDPRPDGVRPSIIAQNATRQHVSRAEHHRESLAKGLKKKPDSAEAKETERPKPQCPETEKLTETLSKLKCLQQGYSTRDHRSKQTSAPSLVRLKGLGAPTPRARGTTPEPFSFQRKLEESLHRKAEFIAHERRRSQENHKTFHAKPAPSAKKKFSLKKTTMPITKVEPFHLLSEARHHIRMESENEKQRRLREYEEESKPFRARTCRSIYQPPFQPKREGSHTLPEDIQLSSTVRAEQRRVYDEKQREAKNKEAAEAAEAERLRKLKEDEELKVERQMRVHKARPAPKRQCLKK